MFTASADGRGSRLLAAFVTVTMFVVTLTPEGAAQDSRATVVNLKNPAVAFTPADATLRVRDSEIRVNGKTLFSVGGEAGGHVIWFSSPRYGRFIFSTRQHPRYKFQQVAVVNNRRIVFDSGGDHFEWILGKALVDDGSIEQLWMMHDRLPEPLREQPDPGGIVGSATHYEYLFDN